MSEETVDKIEFEPIKGYPMLYWKGKRPFTSTQYYPAQLKETYGPEVNGWRNRIYWGDNLQVMSHLLKEFRGKINLIYIDPPFDSKADYKKTIQLRGSEIESNQSAFEEKQYTDIWTNDEYLQFIYDRVILMRELLSDEGSFFLHCDWHKVHQLRCILDEVFGPANFENDIVWYHPGGGASGLRFARKHDNLLYYAKRSDSKTFNTDDVRVAYQTENIGPQTYNFETNKKKRPGFKDGYTYVPNEKGKFAPDVWNDIEREEKDSDLWDDIKALYGPSGQITGYPTQKPEALLERVIKATTNEGDLVFDCFMGSGTTQAVAMKLGRRFIGADINLGAVQTTTKRLISIAADLKPRKKLIDENSTLRYLGFEVHNVNHYDVFRNPVQAKELLIEALEIQPLPASFVYDGEKDGRLVKVMPVNRLATRADLNGVIANFDYKAAEQKQNENPNKVVEKILLVCMGHEPDLAAQLKLALAPFKVDVEVIDVLRDRSKLEFKRDSEAKISSTETELVIEKFYPMNLLQKLSLFKENVEDWRELVESVMVDFNYDGAIFQPTVLDIPDKNELVSGKYEIPADAGNIRVKITDLLSESLEVDA